MRSASLDAILGSLHRSASPSKLKSGGNIFSRALRMRLRVWLRIYY